MLITDVTKPAYNAFPAIPGKLGSSGNTFAQTLNSHQTAYAVIKMDPDALVSSGGIYNGNGEAYAYYAENYSADNHLFVVKGTNPDGTPYDVAINANEVDPRNATYIEMIALQAFVRAQGRSDCGNFVKPLSFFFSPDYNAKFNFMVCVEEQAVNKNIDKKAQLEAKNLLDFFVQHLHKNYESNQGYKNFADNYLDINSAVMAENTNPPAQTKVYYWPPPPDAGAAERAAGVRAALDDETLMYLEMFADVYNQIAAIHSDGFELIRLTGAMFSEDENNRIHQISRDFHAALFAAGLPGYSPPGLNREKLMNYYGLSEPIQGKPSLDSYYPMTVESLFYAEKYGLAGLTKEEQIAAVLGPLKNSSPSELAGAAGLLYVIGAIDAGTGFRIGDVATFVGMSGMSDNYKIKTGGIQNPYTTSVNWVGLLGEFDELDWLNSIRVFLSNLWADKNDPEQDQPESKHQQEAIAMEMIATHNETVRQGQGLRYK